MSTLVWSRHQPNNDHTDTQKNVIFQRIIPQFWVTVVFQTIMTPPDIGLLCAALHLWMGVTST